METIVTMESLASELSLIRAENKQIIKMLRKIKSTQDDPDGSKKKERSKNNGFSKPQSVSDDLRAFLGLAADEKISRSEVTKRVSAYAKDNGLQDPTNGRHIILDEKLTKLLNPPEGVQVMFLNLQTYLKPHYLKDSPEAPEAPAPVAAPAAAEPAPAAVPRPVIKKKKVVAA